MILKFWIILGQLISQVIWKYGESEQLDFLLYTNTETIYLDKFLQYFSPLGASYMRTWSIEPLKAWSCNAITLISFQS